MHIIRTTAALLAVLTSSFAIAQENLDDIPVAKATASADADTPVAKATEPTTRPLSVEITLGNQSVIRGTLTNTLEVSMKTSFGEVAVPLTEVAGIKFANQEDTTTSIVMLNGDSVTGATDVKLLTVETEWGAAQVNGSGVSSILLVPNLQWSSIAGLNGKRWYLTERNQMPSSTQRASINPNTGRPTTNNGVGRPLSAPYNPR